jgi:Family of unknown function (DUF5681)
VNWGSKWPDKPDYEVGYGKPPKERRFKPGQSGNASGRPKRSKNAKTLLREALDEIVVVTEAGVQQRMSKREVFFKTLVARAMKDNRYAALLMKTMDQYGLIESDKYSEGMKIIFVKPDEKG